ncbi:MAG TPA: hypothetical protein DCP73_13785 [Chloroflexi bacterium]|nr:hypothetical protein [Chloroflexota bacterium]
MNGHDGCPLARPEQRKRFRANMIRAVQNGPDAGSARHCTPKHQRNLDRQSDAFKAVMGRRPGSRRTCPSIGQQVFRITSGGEDRDVDWERVVPR